MKSHLLRDESDVQLIREFIMHLPFESTVVGFEESMLLASVKSTTRLWQHNGTVVGFAFVDDYNNLRFEFETNSLSAQLEDEIIEWGITCVKTRNTETGADKTLDASFKTENTWQIKMLERAGFIRSQQRTLSYARPLFQHIEAHAFPPGFSLRCVTGEHEVDNLVGLHRAAFGTENMTVAHRIAIMHAPAYQRELDLVIVAADGELAAFCICGFEAVMGSEKAGFTDPIGTHPRYRRQGLAKAVITAGLQRLRSGGASFVKLSTLSTNIPMQRLAESLGFVCVSEKVWFSKEVT
jgi:mycothiol synthase